MDAKLLAAAVRARRLPVVYASTCGLYDRRDPAWKTEDEAVTAVSPYFAAKLRGESQFLAALPSAMVIRLSAPYGLGLRRGLILARFAEMARAGQILEVWGDGLREQDFLHASDIADFITAALAAPRHGVWNVAAGRPTTMLALARLCVSVAGRGALERRTSPDPADGQTARYAIAAAERDFAWRPRRALANWLAHYQPQDLQ
jgi:UDP-glucose 4-epimerase